MSRLHTLMTSAEAVAAHFGAVPAESIEIPAETVEGLAGVVVIEHRGQRRLGNMIWGLPRQTREMREHGDPPGRIGLVANLTNPLWDRWWSTRANAA